MKILYMLPLLIIGCNSGPSSDEKAKIDLAILMHNNSFGLKFQSDSINQRSELIGANNWKGKQFAERYADSSIHATYKNYNNPYNPGADPRLTYEKFISYCKESKLDPVKFSETLK